MSLGNDLSFFSAQLLVEEFYENNTLQLITIPISNKILCIFRRWAKDTHDFIESLWTSENGGKMGISLISCTRLNHDPSNASVWKEIVYGFREISNEEIQDFGRLTGQHLRGYQFMTYTIGKSIF